MDFVRLKCGIAPLQLANRLKYNPEILELQLFEQDLADPERICLIIQALKKRGIQVYLHHPMKYKGIFVDILSEDRERRNFYDGSCFLLHEICKKERVQCVVHPHYRDSESSRLYDSFTQAKMRRRLSFFLDRCGDSFLWENTTQGIFSWQNPRFVQDIVEPLQLPVCMDISHAFIAFQGDQARLVESMEAIAPFADYYHVVDSLGVSHDSLSIGQGRIQWESIWPFLDQKKFIFEIGLADYQDCTPMLNSARNYREWVQRQAALLNVADNDGRSNGHPIW